MGKNRISYGNTADHIRTCKNSTDRPLLNGHMNVAYISELMEARRPKYEAAADILVATDRKTKEEIAEEIIGRLEE